jgi:Double zinc ribbon
MLICQSCKNELPERGFHCPHCGVRTKCKACHDALEPGARFCVNCGAPTEADDQAIETSNGDDTGGTFNIISYNEDTRSRTFNAKLTDRAFESGSDVLGIFLAGKLAQPVRRVRQTASGEDGLDAQATLPGIEGDDADETVPIEPPQPTQKAITAGSEEAQLRNIFRANGNELRLINTRLKQKSKGDFVTRVSVLFLYAHELAGRDGVPREDLKALLEDAKVYDGNARKWLGGNDFISRNGNAVELSVPGRELAKDILIQVADPNIDTTWTVGTKGKSRSKSGKSDETPASEDGGKGKGRKASGTSYRAMTRKLYEDAFFVDAKTGVEARDELTRRGYSFTLGRVNEALTVLLKEELLTREKNGAGEWQYKNK